MEKLIALDIETSNGKGSGSLDPRLEGSCIALVQLGYEDGRIDILDWDKETEALLIRLDEEGYRFVIHNAHFELDWFRVKSDFWPKKVWCTQIASQVLNAGKVIVDESTKLSVRMESKNSDFLGAWDPLFEEREENIVQVGKSASRFSHSYQATVHRYVGELVQKDQGNSDWLRRPLTKDQIRYAMDDVKYGVQVARRQWHFMQKLGLDQVAMLEMDILPAVAEMKYIGIKIDKDKWAASAQEYGAEAAKLESTLNEKLGMEAAEQEGNVSLFGRVIPKAFNVASPAQLSRFFGVEKADESTLKVLDHPLISDILKFKENIKIASTYGDGYMKHIREDGRIHTLLIQAATATGRFSSRSPNLQNCPPDMIKQFVTTEDDKVVAFADYSAVESRILAYVSGDEQFIANVNSRDVHWENAKNIFKLPPDATRDKDYEIEGKLVSGDELRRKSKGLTFGIPYGISGLGLSNRGFADSPEEGDILVSEFYNQFAKVKDFLDIQKGDSLSRGYTQDVFGRIRWYEIPKELELPQFSKEKEKYIKMIGRQAQNHGIQAASADITKVAIRDLYKYLRETGYGYMVLTVHDSIFFELYRDTVKEALAGIKEIMESAGPKVYPDLVTPVDIELGKSWAHLLD